MARMAPAANRMTIVRTKVAKSEVTFSTPTLAKIAVSAAKAADSTAQVCQAVQMLFIAVSEWFESDVWRPAGSAIRRPESTRCCPSRSAYERAGSARKRYFAEGVGCARTNRSG